MTAPTSYKLERSDVTWGIVAIGALLISLSDVNGAFLMVLLGTPAAIVLFFIRLSDTPSAEISLPGSRFTEAVCWLAIAGPASCSLTTYRTETVMQPVIASIEKYHDAHGAYPDDLKQLGVSIPRCPDTQRRVIYVRKESPEAFVLICPTYALNKHRYDSGSKQWGDID